MNKTNYRYLFRGKREDNDEWVYGYYVGPTGDMDDHEICDINDSLGSRVEVDPDAVSQCTGGTASKSYRGDNEFGKLIFEGDIVCADDGAPGVVCMLEGGWCIAYNTYFEPLYDCTEWLKIIGNRWGSPWLMEE